VKLEKTKFSFLIHSGSVKVCLFLYTLNTTVFGRDERKLNTTLRTEFATKRSKLSLWQMYEERKKKKLTGPFHNSKSEAKYIASQVEVYVISIKSNT